MSGSQLVGVVMGGLLMLGGLLMSLMPRRAARRNATWGPGWVRSYNGGSIRPTNPRGMRWLGLYIAALGVLTIVLLLVGN